MGTVLKRNQRKVVGNAGKGLYIGLTGLAIYVSRIPGMHILGHIAGHKMKKTFDNIDKWINEGDTS